ncbi:MAG TPA: hypothetical protein DCL43_11790 [Chitinophagaceae bacterium]|nr:hypothetical protein [Chitinophagaceae bacterium]
MKSAFEQRKVHGTGRFSAWALIIGLAIGAASFGLIIALTIPEREVAVRPAATSALYQQPATKVGLVSLNNHGTLTVNDASFYQRLVLPELVSSFNILDNLMIITLGIIYFLIRRRSKEIQHLQADVSKLLRYAGIVCILFYFVVPLQQYLALQEVKTLTDGNFVLVTTTRNGFQLWLGIVCLWFADIYRKAFLLQQDSNLTI